MTEHGDKEIKELFERMRARDRETAPSFQATLEGGSSSTTDRPSVFSLPKLAAVTALLALVSTVFLIQFRERPDRSAVQAAADISEWVSPTQSLLRSPTQELLAGQVRLIADYDWTPAPADPKTTPLREEERK